jgi:hypothetical protein
MIEIVEESDGGFAGIACGGGDGIAGADGLAGGFEDLADADHEDEHEGDGEHDLDEGETGKTMDN